MVRATRSLFGAAAAAGAISLSPAARADEGCNANFVTVSLTALARGQPITGPVSPGQEITLRAGVTVPRSKPPFLYCCVMRGLLTIELPGGGKAQAEVDLSCERMPFLLSVPYVVSADDAHECRLSAHARYTDGVYDSDPPTPGAGGAASLSLLLDDCCSGDLNGDGTVDVEDLIFVVVSWGPCSELCQADVNGDGHVDIADFIQVLLDWGTCD
jgi:hypothetical protein